MNTNEIPSFNYDVQGVPEATIPGTGLTMYDEIQPELHV
jgi:hypothetical protein